MSTPQLNATAELLHIRQFKRLAKRPKYAVSRLNRYRAELVALRQAGASYRELVLWLRQKKRLKTTHTTVRRYLKQVLELPE